MGYFGVNKKEFNRIKKEAIGFMKGRRPDGKEYNFGVSKKDVERYRKQAKA